MDWINGKASSDTQLLWFYGPAGAGKSAIVQSLAEICEKRKLLLASFFFSRTDPTRNTVNPLAATIAYQITNVIPATAGFIENAVDRELFTQLFETQLMNLVVQPITEFAKQDAAEHFPHLIIIDGLDECFDPNTQAEIVSSISKLLHSDATKPFLLRFLIISRPEQHLQKAFSLVPASMLSCLLLDTPDSDIRVFLQNQFAKIKDSNPAISPGWPTPDVVDLLIRRSCSRFVFASTVVQYISSRKDPVACLDTMLQLQCPPEQKQMPLAELDGIYCHILSSVQDPQTTKLILGVILFVNPDYNLFTPLSSAEISAS